MLIALIALAAAFIAVLTYLLRIKYDIRQLSKSLHSITKTETNAQLTTKSSDKDAAAIAEAINAMLQRNHHTLTEKVRIETELKRTISNISHDLRTPLTSARGFIQMLQSNDLEADVQKRYMETVIGRLDALNTLMNSLFEFTQVVEGRIPLDIKRLNIAGMLREAVAAFYSELTEKGFVIDIDIPEASVYVMADSYAFERILQNILSNVSIHGVDYMTVRLAADGEISVGNRIHDIELIDASRLFERFYTADSSRTNRSTGMGLSITKELVMRMNGHISALVEGGMLVLRIRLPLC